MADIDPKIIEFIEKLENLDRGERARLKRNAGKPLAEAHHGTLGLFYRILPYGVPKVQEEIYFLLATLYPMTDSGNPENLGASLRQAQNDRNKKGLDRRMDILLDADETQLPFRLRQAIRFLASNDKTVNWTHLLRDLLAWKHRNRFVQKEWARAYYA
jgi:CRISPR system Cascade subunit CasB